MEVKAGGTGFQSSYPTQVQAGTNLEQVREPHINEKSVEIGMHYSRDALEKQVDGFNKLLQAEKSHVRFILHDRMNEYYVQVVDDKTSEIIREIPSKKMMDTAAKLYELIGLLVDHKL